MRLTIVSKLRGGLPRKLSLIQQNERCSISFHFLVPAGEMTDDDPHVGLACHFYNSNFQKAEAGTPVTPSAVMSRRVAITY